MATAAAGIGAHEGGIDVLIGNAGVFGPHIPVGIGSDGPTGALRDRHGEPGR